MERRLEIFIASVQQLADVRNLDTFNPIFFQMEHPVNATRYTVVGAKTEPSYMGVPINVTWVVLDPADKYYMQALKLKDSIDPDTVTDKDKVEGLDAWWHLVRTYDDIFVDPQYYVGAVGQKGDKGDPGEPGPEGPAGTVDMDAFLKQAMIKLASLVGTLEIQGPAQVGPNSTTHYQVFITQDEIDKTTGDVVPGVRTEVFPQIRISGTSPSGSTVDTGNNFHAGTPSGGSAPVKLVVEYPSWTKMIQAELNVSVSSASLTGLSITGVAQVYAGKSITLQCVGTFSDGSTANVTASWSVDNLGAASINSSGVLTGVNPISADTMVTVTATSGGFSATKQVQIKKLLANVLTISGPSSVNVGSTGTYTASVSLNSGDTVAVTPTWSITGSSASISSGGVLSATAGGTVTLNASYTLPGTTSPVTASKSVSLVAVATPVYAYYGTGPALPSDWQAFITSLPGRATTTLDTPVDVNIDCIGAAVYEYFAYPASQGGTNGEAQFFDVISQFTGGWGGAGKNGQGTNAATDAAGYDKPFDVNVTINGTSIPFKVYRTENPNLGTAAANKWRVSKLP